MTENKDMQELEAIHEHDEAIVVMTDENGNESYFVEDVVIPIGEDTFALLVSITKEEFESGEINSQDDENVDVFVAKIGFDENNETIYVDPSEEEFQAFQVAYEALDTEDEK
jgi:uncharacterized protein YrzB (UPF0473 family)